MLAAPSVDVDDLEERQGSAPHQGGTGTCAAWLALGSFSWLALCKVSAGEVVTRKHVDFSLVTGGFCVCWKLWIHSWGQYLSWGPSLLLGIKADPPYPEWGSRSPKRLPLSCHCSEWSTTCSSETSAPSLTPVSLTSATQRPSDAPVAPSRPQILLLLSVHPAPALIQVNTSSSPDYRDELFTIFLLIKNNSLKYSWFTMLCLFLLYSKVMVTHTYRQTEYWIWFPVLYSKTLLFIHPSYNS